jgi:hypothetical protein
LDSYIIHASIHYRSVPGSTEPAFASFADLQSPPEIDMDLGFMPIYIKIVDILK